MVDITTMESLFLELPDSFIIMAKTKGLMTLWVKFLELTRQHSLA